MEGTVMGFALIIGYFFPAMNAYWNKKKNASAILLLNMLLGWTVIGWIVALIWSVTRE